MDIEIRALTADDAAQLVQCFERCYGSTYPNETFHSAGAIAELVKNGALKSVVAVANGHLVGHTGLSIRNPDAIVAEAGNTVVDPQYRGEGILGRMGSALGKLCEALGFVGYVHYPTTAHSVMQKRSITGGGVETGLMLGYVPADTDYRDMDQRSGRIAATIVFQPFSEAPALGIHVPRRYGMLLGRLYGTMGLQRERLRSTAPIPAATVATCSHNTRRALLHVHIDQIGADLDAVVEELLAGSNAEIVHADLVLDQPAIDQAVDNLARCGFIYCGLLPYFARSDVLRLQLLRDQPASVFEPELANPDARSLLAVITSERTPAPRARSQPGA